MIRDAVRKTDTARLYDYFEQDYVGVLDQLDAAMRMLASRGSYNQTSSYFSPIDADLRSKLGLAAGIADLSIVSNLLRLGTRASSRSSIFLRTAVRKSPSHGRSSTSTPRPGPPRLTSSPSQRATS